MTDPTGYEELAGLIRAQIAAGALRPGQRLPSEEQYGQMYGLARDTVRRAVTELRYEGLVEVRHGYGTRVFDRGQVVEVEVPAGSVVEARMPTPAERRALAMPVGWPVFVVTEPDGGGPRLYPAHRYRVRAAGPG